MKMNFWTIVDMVMLWASSVLAGAYTGFVIVKPEVVGGYWWYYALGMAICLGMSMMSGSSIIKQLQIREGSKT